MDPDIWFMVAFIVRKHGADAPRVAEEIVERLRREYSAHLGGIEKADIETWLAIRDASVEWLDTTRNAADVAH